MSLSCSCDYDYEYDLGDWLYDSYWSNIVFKSFRATRRKRCCSCKKLINFEEPCLEHKRVRYPYTEAESRIRLNMEISEAFEEEPAIPMASHYQCERCGEIWLNLSSIGYNCLGQDENMEEALREYHELSGFVSEVSYGYRGMEEVE